MWIGQLKTEKGKFTIISTGSSRSILNMLAEVNRMEWCKFSKNKVVWSVVGSVGKVVNKLKCKACDGEQTSNVS